MIRPPRKPLPIIRNERGTAVTEFVVTLPILLLFLFGLTGIAQAIWYHHIITKGVRDGTRYLTRTPLPPDASCPEDDFGEIGDADSDFLSEARNVAMSGSLTGTSTLWGNPNNIKIYCEDKKGTTFRTSRVTIARMTATVPVEIPSFPVPLLGLAPSITYVVTDQARWIGE